MEFTIEEKIQFPRKVVYTTLRDKLSELVPFIPNIKKIEILKKKKTKGKFILRIAGLRTIRFQA